MTRHQDTASTTLVELVQKVGKYTTSNTHNYTHTYREHIAKHRLYSEENQRPNTTTITNALTHDCACASHGNPDVLDDSVEFLWFTILILTVKALKNNNLPFKGVKKELFNN